MMGGDKKEGDKQPRYSGKLPESAKNYDPKKDILIWLTKNSPHDLNLDAVKQSALEKYKGVLPDDYITSVVNAEYAKGTVAEIDVRKMDIEKLNASIDELIYGKDEKNPGLEAHKRAIAGVENELIEQQRQLKELDDQIDFAIKQEKLKKEKHDIARKKTELDAMEAKYSGKTKELEEDYKKKAEELDSKYKTLVGEINTKQSALNTIRDNFKKVAENLDGKWKFAEKLKAELAAKEDEVRKLLPTAMQTVRQIYTESDEKTRKVYERLIYYHEHQLELKEAELGRKETEHKLREDDLRIRLEKEANERYLYEKEILKFQEDIRMVKRFFPDITVDAQWDSHDYIGNMGYVLRKLDKRLTTQEMRIKGHVEREYAMLGIIETLSGELTDTGRILVRYAVQISLPGREAIQRYVLAQIDENKFTDAKKFLSEMKVPMELVSRVNETVTVIDKYEGIQGKRKKDLKKMLPPMPEEEQKAVVVEEDPLKP